MRLPCEHVVVVNTHMVQPGEHVVIITQMIQPGEHVVDVNTHDTKVGRSKLPQVSTVRFSQLTTPVNMPKSGQYESEWSFEILITVLVVD